MVDTLDGMFHAASYMSTLESAHRKFAPNHFHLAKLVFPSRDAFPSIIFLLLISNKDI